MVGVVFSCKAAAHAFTPIPTQMGARYPSDGARGKWRFPLLWETVLRSFVIFWTATPVLGLLIDMESFFRRLMLSTVNLQ